LGCSGTGEMSRSLGKTTIFRRAKIRILVPLYKQPTIINNKQQLRYLYLNIKIMYSIRTKVFLKVYEGYSQKGKQLPHSVC